MYPREDWGIVSGQLVELEMSRGLGLVVVGQAQKVVTAKCCGGPNVAVLIALERVGPRIRPSHGPGMLEGRRTGQVASEQRLDAQSAPRTAPESTNSGRRCWGLPTTSRKSRKTQQRLMRGSVATDHNTNTNTPRRHPLLPCLALQSSRDTFAARLQAADSPWPWASLIPTTKDLGSLFSTIASHRDRPLATPPPLPPHRGPPWTPSTSTSTMRSSTT